MWEKWGRHVWEKWGVLGDSFLPVAHLEARIGERAQVRGGAARGDLLELWVLGVHAPADAPRAREMAKRLLDFIATT